MAQEFHLSITPLGENKYLIRTERVAVGVPLAEEEIILPIKDWLPEIELNPLEFGERLYNAIFLGTIRDSWMTAQGIAQYKQQILHLRLNLRGKCTPQLPWESLCDGINPIAISTDILFSRYFSGKDIFKKSTSNSTQLKVLLVLSAYSIKESLELKKEVISLEEEASKYQIQLTILDQPNRKQLVSTLEQESFQIFHYAGYTELSAFNSGITLVDSESGLTEEVSNRSLSNLLSSNGIQMAIICPHLRNQSEPYRQIHNQSDCLTNESILSIPASLYMREAISCDVAITLNRLLYHNLNQNQPIDLVINRVRSGLMSSYNSSEKYWTYPLLYLSPEFDGFTTSASDITSDKPVEAPSVEIGLTLKTDIAETLSILLLAADPTNASRLRIGEEFREIQEKLQLAKLREKFRIEQRTSVRPTDLSQVLLDLQPQILHFSGHGMESGALCFENQIGQIHPISPDALAALFEQFKDQVKCVLLNACYSEIQAVAISEHIDYVVGMNKAIGDKAAIAFSIGFYQGLGAGRTIEGAYKLGCVQVRLQGIPEHLTPVLVKQGEVKV